MLAFGGLLRCKRYIRPGSDQHKEWLPCLRFPFFDYARQGAHRPGLQVRPPVNALKGT